MVKTDPQSTKRELAVSFDRKIRWKITPTIRATGRKDVWVIGNIYTYSIAFLRMYEIDLRDDDRYRIALDAYWNFWEM